MSHNLKRLLIAVYICLVCLLAIATFLEQACGTDFVEKYIYHTFWFLLSLGDSGCSGCYGINQTAAMEASSHIVVAWFLPCDFGGSHAYVCQQPERICAPYRRK